MPSFSPVFVMLIILLTLGAKPCLGQPLNSSDQGIDMVAIVDQSGSMIGEGSRARNDPHGVRNRVVFNALTTLGMSANADKLEHRLGVISFGSQLRVDMELESVRKVNIKDLRNKLYRNLKDDVSLGNTDFMAAFREARRMFDSVDNEQGRRRILILITDGAPYLERFETEGINFVTNLEAYKSDLQLFVRQSFPREHYDFRVFGLNDESSDYWARFGPFWNDLTGGKAVKLENSDEFSIYEKLQKAISIELKNESVKVPEGLYDDLFMPPYLETVVFHVFSVEPSARVDFFRPSDRVSPISPDNGNVEVFDTGTASKTVTIQKPEPGSWKIHKTNPRARVDIYTQRFFTKGELLVPNADAQVKQYQETEIHYRVVDSLGQPIQILPEYPLSLDLVLESPDGTVTNYQMLSQEEDLPGLFKTDSAIQFMQSGRYMTRVTVYTANHTYQRIPIYADRLSGFDVQAAQKITGVLKLESGDGESPFWGTWIFTPNPVSLTISYKDSQGKPVNIESLLGGQIEDLIVFDDRARALEPYQYSLVLDRPGTYRVSLPALGFGNHEISVRMLANNPDYVIAISPVSVSINRYLTGWHWVQTLGPLVVLIVIALLTGRVIYLNKAYPLRGCLVIEQLGHAYKKRLDLNPSKHQMVLNSSILPNQVALKKVIVQARRSRKRPGVVITAYAKKKKKALLEKRALADGGTAVLRSLPYQIRYKAD